MKMTYWFIAPEEDGGARGLEFIIHQYIVVGPQIGHRHFVDKPLPGVALFLLWTLRRVSAKP